MINTGGNLSKNIMDTLRNANRLMGGTPGRRRQMAEEKRDEQSVQKPIDNSHSHSKQESQNGAMGSFAAFGGGTGSQNPNTNLAEIGRNAFSGIGLKRKNMNNNFTNPDSQTVASGMFQGQELENQMAQRRSTPTPVPGGSGDQDISPLMQQQKGKTQTVQNDPKLQEGSDASYGISGYVNTEKEYKQALQEKNHPNVYNSPVKQTPYPHNNKYVYKPGDLMDESDQEESQFKSSNNPDKLISGKTYNVENVSDVQEDKKGQFMTTLSDDEHYGMEKRPTSSKVTNYDQGRNAVRDTLRPAQGNKFKSLWKNK